MSDVPGAASAGLVAFLFAIFTASWAQNSRRNPWLWFAFGFLLPPVAGLVLLWKNRQHEISRLTDPGRPDLLSTRKDVI